MINFEYLKRKYHIGDLRFSTSCLKATKEGSDSAPFQSMNLILRVDIHSSVGSRADTRRFKGHSVKKFPTNRAGIVATNGELVHGAYFDLKTLSDQANLQRIIGKKRGICGQEGGGIHHHWKKQNGTNDISKRSNLLPL